MIYANFIKFIIIALSLGLGSASAEVVTVVSANNPLTALSKKQIVDIFLGKASRFPDGQQAMPVDQGESAAAHEEFYLKFADKTPAQIRAFWSKIIFTGRGQPPPEVPNDIEVKKFISKYPDAIGYINRERVDDSVRVIFTK